VTNEVHAEETNDESVDLRVGLTETEAALIPLIEPTIESIGLELAHLELEESSQQILRIFIDSPSGVSIDDCARASRHLSAMLDVEEPIETAYSLEVSTPGVDRPLGRLSDWISVVGETINVKTGRSIEGRRRWTGTLTGISDATATVIVDGQTHAVPLDLVRKANLKYSFDKPRPGKSNR